VKYLLPLGIEQLKFTLSTSEKSEQVCFGGGHGLFGLIQAALLRACDPLLGHKL